MSGDWAPVVGMGVIALSVGGTFVLRGPLGRALAVRLAGRGAAPPAEVDELRGEVEELRRQLGEVHERLDFAERLLARQGEPNRLGPGARV